MGSSQAGSEQVGLFGRKRKLPDVGVRTKARIRRTAWAPAFAGELGGERVSYEDRIIAFGARADQRHRAAD